jgi:drug/metabolite transporter (DMT)-like permease
MTAGAHQQGDRVMLGIGCRLLAILLLSTLGALIKLSETRGANLVEIMFWRQGTAIPVVLAWMAMGSGLGAVRTKAFRGQAIRAFVGLTGMCFNFGTIMLLPLAEATTLGYTVPIFATILGALVLKEPTGKHRWGAVIVGFIGVLVVFQPWSGHFSWIGVSSGLIASVFVAIVAIQLRQIGKVDLPVTTVFYFSALSMIPLGIAMPFFIQPHDASTYGIMAAMGLFGGLGQIAFTAALKFAPVSTVMPMDYSNLLWSTLYGYLLFSVLPTPWTWVGAPIIIASGAYIAWREHVKKRAELSSEAAIELDV